MSIGISGSVIIEGTVNFLSTELSPPRWTNPIEQKIQSSDPESNDFLGKSVSISADGNTAIVGAYFKGGATAGEGAAYVFTRSGNTWTEQQKIQASDIEENDQFGFSVAISSDGNTAIISSYLEDTGGASAGAAYIFVRTGGVWTEQQKIQASDIEAGDQFGFSVAISADGNTVIVGARREAAGGNDAGAAYVFTRSGNTWTEQQKLTASDIEAGDYFGWKVDIAADGNTALISAYGEDTKGTDAGAAYIFVRTGGVWTEQQKIQASDIEAGDRFGESVSLSADGNTAVIGAAFEDAGGSNAGAAYIFTRTGGVWTEQQKLTASDASNGARFGWAVSISADKNTLIIGSRSAAVPGGFGGAVYIFALSNETWSEQKKIQSSDLQTDALFGESVSISADGNTVIVGTPQDNTVLTAAGAAYVYMT